MMKKDIPASLIVVGTQWGDEGKAKIIDILTPYFDIVGRYQGGGNAGHTVVINGEKIIFHYIPTGIVHPDKMVVLGNGMVIDPYKLIEEMEQLSQRGYDFQGRLFISNRAHVTLPYHLMKERYEEGKLREGKIGTTMRGIGPTYEDKIARHGIIMADLLNHKRLQARLSSILHLKNEVMQKVYNAPPLDPSQLLRDVEPAVKILQPYVVNTSRWLHEQLTAGNSLLCEGAQGTHLDIDHGTYPYVTSSNSSAGGALTGLGLGPRHFHHVLGITKAYITRVGEGPFPTEEKGELGERLRTVGHEFGSTTGRPRRCGWFDVPVLRYSARINGLTALAVTKLDVLSGLDSIKVCTAYRLHGSIIEEFPDDPEMLSQIEPIYEELPGWNEDISQIKDYHTLPENARAYLRFLQESIGVEIAVVSVGPEREKCFTIKNLMPHIEDYDK